MVAKSCTEVNDVKIPFYLRRIVQMDREELDEISTMIVGCTPEEAVEKLRLIGY